MVSGYRCSKLRSVSSPLVPGKERELVKNSVCAEISECCLDRQFLLLTAVTRAGFFVFRFACLLERSGINLCLSLRF